MVLEKQIVPFLQWAMVGIPLFLLLMLCLVAFASLVAFLVGAARNGPGVAMRSVRSFVGQGLSDLSMISFRRVYAMAQLAVKESLRSYVLVVFVVFAIIFLFAGWYLDSDSDNPAVLYISFVLKMTNFLVVLLTIFLAAFSLPKDIESRTIYTVVTKPVRAWEIVLGRILGFATVGTVIIATMCLVSYLFVIRGLDHSHTVSVESYRQAEGSNGSWVGRTTMDKGHSHEFTLNADGEGVTDEVRGHYHMVSASDPSNPETIKIGRPLGTLQARVPRYGELRFLSRKGLPGKGISVGKEWSYRGYIEGRTLAAGIWRFNNLKSRDIPSDGLPIEMSIRVFRTFQGNIDQGILGSMELRNPNPLLSSEDPNDRKKLPGDTVVKSRPISFIAQDTVSESRTIPREMECQLLNGTWVQVDDVFDELVKDGSLDIVVRCDKRAQYFGMAKTDLYVRASDRSFFVNFVKSHITIWLQMLIVASFGVMFSTLLTGSVAWLATIFALAVGFFADSIIAVATGEQKGGGPIESAVRIVTQQNQSADLGGGVGLWFAKVFDLVSMFLMRILTYLTPNFRDFAEYGGLNTTRFVAYGFDIPSGLMWQHFLTSISYVIIATVFGYIFLKTKEVAA